MTGVDLGPPPPGGNAGGNSRSDELLTTPKVESPRYGSLRSSQQSQQHGEDMLTTPVLTTPKTADYWLTMSTKEGGVPFSPTGPVGGGHLPPPPKELPMDSDIGLRSPCDGLLHKRRMFKNKINSGNSVNSDSNSCDTPGSDNSPKDLTISSVIKEEPDKEEDSSSAANPLAHLRRQISKPDSKNGGAYTQSPLAVPSPNWNVVERYIGVEILKTPKLLDNSYFDFLAPPTTPKNGKMSGNRDISPGSEADRYSGRDQRLSPRLSPRFPIPEAPTDLSKNNSANNDRIPPLGRLGDKGIYEAEDLSISKQASNTSTNHNNNNNNNNNNSSSLKPRSPRSSPQVQPLKREYSPPPAMEIQQKSIKTEMDCGEPPPYDYRTNAAHASHSGPFSPFYLSHQFHPVLYPRQIYSDLHNGNRQTLNRSSPQIENYESSYQHAQQQPLSWPQHLGNNHNIHNWTTPTCNDEDRDASSSPPYSKAPTISVKPPSLLLNGDNAKSTSFIHSSDSKKAKRKNKTSPKPPSQKERTEKGKNEKDRTKRVYNCPQCQRSYDWNYNLNRHLKYECRKENAFQCSKCSRKFPHKQNCVYHLKRKHKIVCESIDQYVSKGFVIFQGSSTHPSSSSSSSSIPAPPQGHNPCESMAIS